MSISVRVKQNDDFVDFDIPTEWKDMTLKYWTGLAEIINTNRKKTELKKNSVEETTDQAFIEQELNNIEFFDEIKLSKDIFCYVSGIDQKDIEKVNMEGIHKVINAMNVLQEEYEPTGVRKFKFEEEEYYFPTENLTKNTYGDFIESTQLDMAIDSFKAGRFSILAKQMAILCRKRGEKYDDEKIDEKAKKFENLTMDIVMEFGFFLTIQNSRLLETFHTYSEKQESQ